MNKSYLTDCIAKFFKDELKFQFFSTRSKKREVAFNKLYETDYFLLYVQNGNFKVVSDGKSVELNNGDVFLCRPYEKFDLIVLKENEEMQFATISFHPSLLESCDKESKIYRAFEKQERNKLCVYSHEELTEVDFLIKRAYKDVLKSKHTEIFKSIIVLILSELCEVYDKIHQHLPAKFSHEYDLKIFKYITSRTLTKIKIADVMEEFFVSEKYVNKVCKKFYNTKFCEMLKNERMWAARGFMMYKKTNELHKIAELCGYNDYSAFYKNYKKYFGTSPKDDLMFYQKNKYFYQKNLDNK